MHVVAGARELLRAGNARRTRADEGDFLARLLRRLFRLEPLRDRIIRDCALHRFDGYWIVLEVERAPGVARRGTDPPGEIGEVVGRVQIACRFVPLATVDEVVPIRNLVVHRAAGRRAGDAAGAVAITPPAIHAAPRPLSQFIFRRRQDEFLPVPDALFDRLVVPIFALEFQKAGDLTHLTPRPAWWRPSPLPSRRARGDIRPASLS